MTQGLQWASEHGDIFELALSFCAGEMWGPGQHSRLLFDIKLCFICAGVIRALRKDDYITSTYRDHVHALSKGVPARNIMAELFGKKTGICRGQGGSMHMFSREHNLVGGAVVAVCLLCACSAASTTLCARDGSTFLFAALHIVPPAHNSAAVMLDAVQTCLQGFSAVAWKPDPSAGLAAQDCFRTVPSSACS